MFTKEPVGLEHDLFCSSILTLPISQVPRTNERFTRQNWITQFARKRQTFGREDGGTGIVAAMHRQYLRRVERLEAHAGGGITRPLQRAFNPVLTFAVEPWSEPESVQQHGSPQQSVQVVSFIEPHEGEPNVVAFSGNDG